MKLKMHYHRLFLLGVVAVAAALGCDTERPQGTSTPDPTPTSTDTGSVRPRDAGSDARGGTSVVRRQKTSRYPKKSPFWKVLSKAPPGSGRHSDAWYSWGPARFVLEATVATAASVPLQRTVSYASVQSSLCKADPNRSCEVSDILASRETRAYKIEQLEGAVSEPTRAVAMANCAGRVDKIIDKMSDALAKKSGVMVIGYVEGQHVFRDSDVGDPWRNFHPFTVIRADKEEGLLVLDSAETAPFVYQVIRDKVCTFLAAPQAGDLRFAEPPPETPRYGLNVWTVKATTAPKAPDRRRRPPTPPTPTPPRPTDPDAGAPPRPSDPDPSTPSCESTVGLLAAGGVDLGTFALPAGEREAKLFTFPSEPRHLGKLLEPRPGLLGIAVSLESGHSNSRWLDDVERRCEVRSARCSDGTADCFVHGCYGQDFWKVVYDAASTRSATDWAKPLAERFRCAGAHAEDRKRWEIMGVIRFVQEIKYNCDDIGRAHNLLPPAEILAYRYGDCDSKSLLSANLLALLGYRAAVIVMEQYNHAVLGVVDGDMRWVSGGPRYVGPDGRSYIATEVTTPGWEPGDPLHPAAYFRLKNQQGRSIVYPIGAE